MKYIVLLDELGVGKIGKFYKESTCPESMF